MRAILPAMAGSTAGRLERRGDAASVAAPADRAWSDRVASSWILRRWPAVVALVVVAHLGFGVLGRGLWKPDEPREAAIAARMARPGADLAVPHLGRDAFCEKPPLYYWVAAFSFRVIGGGPVSVRLPNLAYALAGALLVGLLARAAGGPLAALAAGVAMGTLYLAYRVEVWIATDALLMACVAGALLGCSRGFSAPRGVSKLAWYAFMHACLAAGFLTKNAVAWMVPAMALLVVVVWTRRWRELLAWELISGFAIQVAAVLPWVLAVAARPQGAGYLKTFFFNNLVGRFTAVEGVGYTRSHPGWPGAYLVELPAYLLPWTLLFVAAAVAAWFATRSASTSRGDPGPQTLAWRFAVAAIVPGLVALSASATMRDIYAGVLMPGFALLGGLWVARAAAAPGRLDLAMVRATAALLAAIALLLPPFLLAAVVRLRAATPWLPLLLLLGRLARRPRTLVVLVEGGPAAARRGRPRACPGRLGRRLVVRSAVGLPGDQPGPGHRPGRAGGRCGGRVAPARAVATRRDDHRGVGLRGRPHASPRLRPRRAAARSRPRAGPAAGGRGDQEQGQRTGGRRASRGVRHVRTAPDRPAGSGWPLLRDPRSRRRAVTEVRARAGGARGGCAP